MVRILLFVVYGHCAIRLKVWGREICTVKLNLDNSFGEINVIVMLV